MRIIFALMLSCSLLVPTLASAKGALRGRLHPALPVEGALPAPEIEKIERAYQNLADLRADFTSATLVKSLGRDVQNHGVLYLQKPGRLRIEYQGAPPRHYISDGKRIWIYTPGDPQVMTGKLGDAGIAREALAFLGGFGKLREQFTVDDSAGKGALTLTPKATPAAYQKLEGTFNAAGLLTDLTVFNNDGGTARYHFTNLTTNPGLSPEFFRWPPKTIDPPRKLR